MKTPAVAILALVALACSPAAAFTCCWFQNQYDHSLYGVVSVGDGYRCPGIQDWGSAKKSWFVVNPLNCYNGPPNSTFVATGNSEPTRHLAAKPLADAATAGEPDPCHCCFYAKPQYYMTQPIQCVEPNPASGSYCSSSYEGLTLGGTWIVGNLDFPNQACFFETFSSLDDA